jgi:hypothetical protein
MTENIFTTHTEPQTDPAGNPTLRLSMATHQIKFHAMFARGFCHRLRVQFAEKKVKPGQIRDAGQFGIHHGQDGASNRSREGVFRMTEKCVGRAPPPSC